MPDKKEKFAVNVASKLIKKPVKNLIGKPVGAAVNIADKAVKTTSKVGLSLTGAMVKPAAVITTAAVKAATEVVDEVSGGRTEKYTSVIRDKTDSIVFDAADKGKGYIKSAKEFINKKNTNSKQD